MAPSSGDRTLPSPSVVTVLSSSDVDQLPEGSRDSIETPPTPKTAVHQLGTYIPDEKEDDDIREDRRRAQSRALRQQSGTGVLSSHGRTMEVVPPMLLW